LGALLLKTLAGNFGTYGPSTDKTNHGYDNCQVSKASKLAGRRIGGAVARFGQQITQVKILAAGLTPESLGYAKRTVEKCGVGNAGVEPADFSTIEIAEKTAISRWQSGARATRFESRLSGPNLFAFSA
jgi:hypothetical protein